MGNSRAVKTDCQPRNLECFSAAYRSTVVVLNQCSLWQAQEFTNHLIRPRWHTQWFFTPYWCLKIDTAVDPLPSENFLPPSASSLATQLSLLRLYQLILLTFWLGTSPRPWFLASPLVLHIINWGPNLPTLVLTQYLGTLPAGPFWVRGGIWQYGSFSVIPLVPMRYSVWLHLFIDKEKMLTHAFICPTCSCNGKFSLSKVQISSIKYQAKCCSVRSQHTGWKQT